MAAPQSGKLAEILSQCNLPQDANQAVLDRVLARLSGTPGASQSKDSAVAERIHASTNAGVNPTLQAVSSGERGAAPSPYPDTVYHSDMSARHNHVGFTPAPSLHSYAAGPQSFANPSTYTGGIKSRPRPSSAPRASSAPRRPPHATVGGGGGGVCGSATGWPDNSVSRSTSGSQRGGGAVREAAPDAAAEVRLQRLEEDMMQLKEKNNKLAREKAALTAAAVHNKPAATRATTLWPHDGPGQKRSDSLRLAAVARSLKEALAERDAHQAEALTLRHEKEQLQVQVTHREQEVHLAQADQAETARKLQQEISIRCGLERKMLHEAEVRTGLEKQVAEAQASVQRAAGDLAQLQSQREELLARTLKRDHKIDTLQKKVAALTASVEEERQARQKAEGDMANFEERMRVLRRKNTQLEGKVQAEEKQKQNALAELQIKEEECRLLASMITVSFQQAPQEAPPSDNQSDRVRNGMVGQMHASAGVNASDNRSQLDHLASQPVYSHEGDDMDGHVGGLVYEEGYQEPETGHYGYPLDLNEETPKGSYELHRY